MNVSDIEVHPEVIGLNGGAKQFWLRHHRKEVENYYHAYGPDATLVRFNMKQDTLQRFFERASEDIRLLKLSESDRWVLRVCKAGQRELERRVSDLEIWRSEIEPVIQVGRGIIATLEQSRIQSRKLPQNDDLLRLADLGGKSEK